MSEETLRRNAGYLINILPAADVQKVFTFAMSLYKSTDNPYEPLSEKQMLEDLAVSRQQAAAGKVMDFDEALAEIDQELEL